MASVAAPAARLALVAFVLALALPASALPRKLSAALPDACANPISFEEGQIVQNLLPLQPISVLNLPTLGSVPLDSNILGVQFLQFNIANMGDSNISNFKNAVAGFGKNAIFNTLGGLLAALQPGQSVDVTISPAGGPNTIYFLPRFKNIAAMTVSSVRVGASMVPPSLLDLLGLGVLSINQFAVDNVCIS